MNEQTLYIVHTHSGVNTTDLAKKMAAEDTTIFRVNKDELSAMMGTSHAPGYGIDIRNAVVRELLELGHNVVVDDNIPADSEMQQLMGIAERMGMACVVLEQEIPVGVDILQDTDW